MRKRISQSTFVLACEVLAWSFAERAMPQPNVLFIAADDLNDWIEPLGGHPQVQTPNIDRLSKRGTVFTNAHCAAPLCRPSRAAVFSGCYPARTGVFGNDSPGIRKAHPNLVLLPQHFAQSGYRTFGTGKLLHSKSDGLCDEELYTEQRWSPFTRQQVQYTAEEQPSKGTDDPRHVIKDGPGGRTFVLPFNRMPSDRNPTKPDGESFDWGPVDVADSDMGDGKVTDWAVARLRQHASSDQPFFLAIGFYRPHIPLFAPRAYFDVYPDEQDIRLPQVLANDLDDLSPIARRWAVEAVTAGSHETVLKHGQWKAAVRAYLACVTFVDAQVGRLLDVIDRSPQAANTIVVFWSDHGWHLGEKQHWGKWTGWRRSTRVPLIIAPPRTANGRKFQPNSRCDEPVSLVDLYPTLIDLCGLPGRPGLSGHSLAPLLQDPDQTTERVVATTFDRGNISLIGKQWHFIRYADGSEELYDQRRDPQQWHNLAADSSCQEQLDRMRKQLPSADD